MSIPPLDACGREARLETCLKKYLLYNIDSNSFSFQISFHFPPIYLHTVRFWSPFSRCQFTFTKTICNDWHTEAIQKFTSVQHSSIICSIFSNLADQIDWTLIALCAVRSCRKTLKRRMASSYCIRCGLKSGYINGIRVI